MTWLSRCSALLLSTLAVWGTTFPTLSAVGEEQRVYSYDILREGVPVGTHRVTLERRNDGFLVTAGSRIEIGFLGLTFYRFEYDSIEEWDERGLLRLTVDVNDDGETLEIDGHREGNQFTWRVDDANPRSQEMPVFPTNHWNPAVLSQSRVLNTLTGGISRVSIEPFSGEAPVKVKPGIGVSTYRYNGELEVDVWYGADGRWMGMRFKGRDNSTIEYICRNCDAQRSS